MSFYKSRDDGVGGSKLVYSVLKADLGERAPEDLFPSRAPRIEGDVFLEPPMLHIQNINILSICSAYC